MDTHHERLFNSINSFDILFENSSTKQVLTLAGFGTLAEENISHAEHRLIRVVLHNDNVVVGNDTGIATAISTSVEIEMLRSLEWLDELAARVGGVIFLDMPEMGVCGEAEVLAWQSNRVRGYKPGQAELSPPPSAIVGVLCII